jgi:hypothetical protein
MRHSTCGLKTTKFVVPFNWLSTAENSRLQGANYIGAPE